MREKASGASECFDYSHV